MNVTYVTAIFSILDKEKICFMLVTCVTYVTYRSLTDLKIGNIVMVEPSRGVADPTNLPQLEEEVRSKR